MIFKNAAEHADALKKVAEADVKDAAAAFEVGFIKAAAAMGLNEAEYQELRAKAGKIE